MKKNLQVDKTVSQCVIEAALSIPKGKVTTYGRLARFCGAGQQASRSITAILSKAYNEGVKNIPFHRIVYADGKIWTSPECHAMRITLYKAEGIEIDKNDRVKNFLDILFEFK